jgi:DNA-binding CsgD family transcriptional regulator
VTDIADFVVPGRCGCCGHVTPTWTPQTIVDAARAWHREHGRSPSQRDWPKGGYGHPGKDAVYDVFGAWSTMLKAAGLPPAPLGGPRGQLRWTKDAIADAMLDWLLKHGRWPTVKEWEKASEDHPCVATIYRVLGSWAAAKRAAGWDGQVRRRSSQVTAINQRHEAVKHLRAAGRSQREIAETLGVSQATIARDVGAIVFEPLRCSECGTELENNVIGCGTCHNRHVARKHRQAEAAASSSTSQAAASDERKVLA